MPQTDISPHARIQAILLFDGVGNAGAVNGETRTITGLQVNNTAERRVDLKIEEESTKRSFGGSIRGGQTLNVEAVPNYTITWNAARGFWDGLNIHWVMPPHNG
jgi:hypothetical protein